MTAQKETILMSDAGVVPTRYWHKLDDDRAQCDLCPRECKSQDGERGMCIVRACVDKQIVLTTYGRSTGYCFDSIETKPPNHFKPGTPALLFGTAGEYVASTL